MTTRSASGLSASSGQRAGAAVRQSAVASAVGWCGGSAWRGSYRRSIAGAPDRPARLAAHIRRHDACRCAWMRAGPRKERVQRWRPSATSGCGAASRRSSWRCWRSTSASSTARRTRSASARRCTWSAVWVALALLFNALIWSWFGPTRGLEFLTGYLIEKALSVDNIFVFVVIFSYFAVPAAYQHRVLFWGILGALVMRADLHRRRRRAARAVPLDHLRLRRVPRLHRRQAASCSEQTRTSTPRDEPGAPAVPAVRAAVSPSTTGSSFFVRENGRALRHAAARSCWCWSRPPTSSSPSTRSRRSSPSPRDPFIVYTSNIFAILGLRSLYFLLAGVMDRFHYLKLGLAAGAGLRRRQDAADRRLQDPDRGLAGRGRRDSGRGGRGVAPCHHARAAQGWSSPKPLQYIQLRRMARIGCGLAAGPDPTGGWIYFAIRSIVCPAPPQWCEAVPTPAACLVRRELTRILEGGTCFVIFESRWSRVCLIAAAAALVLIPQPAAAQTLYGSLTGTVTDQQKAAMPGVTVTAINTGTDQSS